MTERELHARKRNRLEQYDYSSAGAYFLTICTKERKNYFWESVGATIGRPQDVPLSPYGKVVDEAIKNIPLIYPSIAVEHYVIMPDHVHLLLLYHGRAMLAPTSDMDGRAMLAPTISRLVQQMKGYVTKQIGKPIWQKLFYDHIIRTREDFAEHMRYIEDNPLKWHYDGPCLP